MSDSDFVTESDCKLNVVTLTMKMENVERTLLKQEAAYTELAKQIQEKATTNGVQDVGMAQIDGRVTALENQDSKKHNWALYLFIGAFTFLNVVATIWNAVK